MNRQRDLILANGAALLLLLAVLLLGWWQEAALGLAVLLFLDLFVFLRARQARAGVEPDGEGEDLVHGQRVDMDAELPAFTYQEARAAYEGGHKLHVGGRIFLVRPALRAQEEGLVLWVTDERTQGDHGWLLFADGRVEVK